ncbi:MAG: tetratricopeptide repeat protein, partial [Thermodesulfobacteriota bacterium]
MIGLDLFTLTVTTIAPGVLSGMIANPSDRAFCRIMGDIVSRMKDGGPPVNHDLQRAARRSYLRAIRGVGLRALAEERERRGWLGRTVGHALFPSETVRSLSDIEKKLNRRIRDVDTAPCVSPPPVEEDEIPLLLQPRDASARERLAALRDQSNEKILRLLEAWRLPIPERFVALVRDGWEERGRRVDGFDLMCGFFQEELKTNEKVRSIFQSQLLANLDIGLDQIIGGLEELGRKLDAMHGDIRDVGEGVRGLERDVRFVRQRLEDGDPASVRDAEPVEYLPLPESRDVLPPVQPLPPNHVMPLRSREGLFVGRMAEIWALHDTLQHRGAAIVDGASGGGEPVGMIVGTGGLGKTQLAAEYVRRFGFLYPGGVFWIPAERGLSEMAAVLARHGAASAELDPRMEIPEQLQAIWRELERRGRDTLVVLDNFPENEPLAPWLPPGAVVRVAVTTRRRDLTRYAEVRLDFMTPEEGARLVNMNRNLGPDAERISEALGGLPLALELARNYLGVQPGMSVEKLLAKMAEFGEMAVLRSFEGKYADQMPSGHVKEVAATIAMSWELASEPARRVLRALALLAPVPVPMRLVRRVFPDWESEDLLEDPVEAAAAELAVKLSLANLDEDADPVVHRLVAGFAREVEEADPDLTDRVARAVEEEMERASDDMDTAALRELGKMVPHAEHLLDAADVGDERAAEISNWLRWHYRNAGQYRNAERAGRLSLEWAERLHEPGHPEIAGRQSNLALVLQDLGELASARELLEQALHFFEESLPLGHPSIARCQSNLAFVLKDLGELAPARELFEKALESDEANFPPGHPSIAISQNNLATVLKD